MLMVFISQQHREDSMSIEVVFELDAYVDADYAQKANDRLSASGAAIFFGGALVTWFSRTQKSVTLSTTKQSTWQWPTG